MKGRLYDDDEVPAKLEKAYAALHAYRTPGTSGFTGSEDCLHVRLKDGWTVTLAPEDTEVKVRLMRGGEIVGDITSFALDAHDAIQQFLHDHGVK